MTLTDIIAKITLFAKRAIVNDNSSSTAASISQSGSGAAITVSKSGSGDAVQITQTGSGNALVVEDSTNPDATPFVVDATGNLIVGDTSAESGVGAGAFPKITVKDGNLGIYTSGNFIDGSFLQLDKARGTDASKSIVAFGDHLGTIQFNGWDGTAFRNAAFIRGFVDATPGANDMPGAIQFATTADGSSSGTERMRILSNGYVGIGTSSPSSKLQVDGDITLTSSTTATTATAGAQTLPANPVGFLVVSINGTSRKIPYYAT